MHDGMPYGWNEGQGQGHSREVDRQSPTGLILYYSDFRNYYTVRMKLPKIIFPLVTVNILQLCIKSRKFISYNYELTVFCISNLTERDFKIYIVT